MNKVVQNIFHSSRENLTFLGILEEKMETLRINAFRLALLQEESRKEYFNFAQKTLA